MKKVIVLGTGMPQADLILALKERKYEVYACSYKEGDSAQKYADYFECINIVDEKAILEYAEKIGADLVYSAGSDVAMPTAFSVCEKLGLPHFCDYETAYICNHKPLLRSRLGDGFKGNLKYRKLFSADGGIDIPFPLMMKPSDSQGQRGVCRVNSEAEFKANFEKSLSFSRENAVIAEEFVEGDEISVNTFSQNGKLLFGLVSDRVIWDEFPGGIIHKHILPSKYAKNEKVMNKINDLVKRTLGALNINNGPAYFQIIVDKNGEPKLIEVTPRLDGCHMWRLIKMSTGVDLMKMSLDALEGKEITGDFSYSVKPYVTEFLCMKPESIFRKDEFDTKNSEFLEWYYNDGDSVKRMNGYMEKCGYIIKPLLR